MVVVMTVIADNIHGKWHLQEMTIVVDVCYYDDFLGDDSCDEW